MKPLQAGRYRQIVTIETQTDGATNAVGVPKKTWTAVYSNIPVEIAPLTSRELTTALQTKTQGTHRIYMRYAPSITSKCRVTYGSRIFTLTGNPINTEERNIELVLTCQEEVI
jgi:SPP1 family predicted phage head-tail adaptor